MGDPKDGTAAEATRWYRDGFTYAHKIKVSPERAADGYEIHQTRGDYEALIASNTTTNWAAVDKALDAAADRQTEASMEQAMEGMTPEARKKLLGHLATKPADIGEDPGGGGPGGHRKE